MDRLLAEHTMTKAEYEALRRARSYARQKQCKVHSRAVPMVPLSEYLKARDECTALRRLLAELRSLQFGSGDVLGEARFDSRDTQSPER